VGTRCCPWPCRWRSLLHVFCDMALGILYQSVSCLMYRTQTVQLTEIFSVIAAICAPAYIFYLPSVKPPSAPANSILRRLRTLDWVGFTGSIGTVVGFSMVLTFAGSTWAWNDHRTITTFVVSGILFIGTFLQQYFVLFTTCEARMFPPGYILKDWTLIMLNVVTAAATANIFVPVYFIPIYFLFVDGDSALMAAVRRLPYIVFLTLMNMSSGALLPRINY
jgi:hypothetical protein